MDLTIVIVNWNGGALLMRCLETIRQYAGPGVQVIVVDNDSADGSREAAQRAYPEFRVVNSGGNLGFGRASNLARDLTSSRLILFLNPDTELMPGTLAEAVRCLSEHGDVGALGCRMLSPDGRVQELGLQWFMTPWTAFLELLLVSKGTVRILRRWLPVVDPNRSGPVQKLYGGFLLARRDVLDAAGWFDERYFMYAEDADLSRTIRDLGWTLYYCAEAAIVHVGGGVTVKAPSTFSVLMRQESINKMIAKYQGRPSAVAHRVAVFVGGASRLAMVLPGRLSVMFGDKGGALARWNASREKQQQLVLWALGLRKAHVPSSRPPAHAASPSGTGLPA